jgi:hypothetical protein
LINGLIFELQPQLRSLPALSQTPQRAFNEKAIGSNPLAGFLLQILSDPMLAGRPWPAMALILDSLQPVSGHPPSEHQGAREHQRRTQKEEIGGLIPAT